MRKRVVAWQFSKFIAPIRPPQPRRLPSKQEMVHPVRYDVYPYHPFPCTAATATSPYPAIFPHRAYTPSHPISSHHPSMSPRRTHRQMTITLASLPRNTLKADIRPFFWRFGEVRRISGGLPRRLSVPYRDMPSNPSARAGGRSSCFGNKRSAARSGVIKSLAWIRIPPYYRAAGQ